MFIDKQDLLYALRSARRTPLLTIVVILALSVGIGLNAGVFTILNSFFFQPPVTKDVASFVRLFPRYEGWFTGAGQFSSFTAEDYDAIHEQSHTLAEAAAWEPIGAMFDDVHQKSSASLVTCNYFHVFGVDRPLLGRFFTADECKPGTTAHVAVLNEMTWKYFYAADPKIVGKVIHVNHEPITVVGVVSSKAVHLIGGGGGLWMPYTLQPVFSHGLNLFHNADYPWLSIGGHLKPGVSRADAKAELEIILHRRDRLYLERKISTLDRKTSLVVTDGSFIQNPQARAKLTILMALIMGPLSLILLLACTNVTMLFLSRSVVRRGETAIRLALGAGRGRLVRMLALESLLTAALAGAISIYLAYRVPVLIMGVIDPLEAMFFGFIQPDWRVFAYMTTLVLVAAIVSALAPVRESFRLDLVTALKGREGSVTMRSRTTSALIVVQLAMSFVLLAAAVLFGRIPGKVTNLDPGFNTRQTMTVPLDINLPPYTKTSAQAFYRSLETRILQVPSVQSFAYASLQPFRQVPPSEIRVDGQSKGHGHPASVDDVSPDFFSTFGVSLLKGRSFQKTDVSGNNRAQIAVVSEAFAKTFWTGKDPLRKTVITPDNQALIVVGVARDTLSEQYGVVDGPRLYTLRDPQSIDGNLFVRFQGDATPVSTAIASIVNNLDANQAGNMPETIQKNIEEIAVEMTSLAKIILFMAGVAVMLAITGIYGVLSFAINQRTREFGIQMVLGATRQSIFRAVIFRGIRQIAIGLLCGVALATPAAWVFAHMTQNSPVQIKAFDPITYSISAVILIVVSLTAMYLPALRATKVDPIEALRND
jgi:predicted permease